MIVTLPSTAVASGNHTFSANTVDPNGVADVNTFNDDASSSFDMVLDGDLTTLYLAADCWGNEITWQIEEQLTSSVLYSGGPYTVAQPAGMQIWESFCLESDCYNFKIFDSYGDGMTGVNCNISGYYNIQNSNSDTIVEMIAAGADYGSSETNVFCVSQLNTVKENVLENIDLFPNPNDGSFSVNVGYDLTRVEIHIYDAMGRFIQRVEKPFIGEGISQSINLELANGLYLIQLRSNEGIASMRMVVEK